MQCNQQGLILALPENLFAYNKRLVGPWIVCELIVTCEKVHASLDSQHTFSMDSLRWEGELATKLYMKVIYIVFSI